MVKDAVVKGLEDLGNRIVALLNQHGFDIQIAAWRYSESSKSWELVLVTPLYDREGPLKSYARIRAILEKNEEMQKDIKLDDIRLLSPGNPFLTIIHRSLQSGSGSVLVPPLNSGLSADYDAYYYRFH